MRSWYVLTYKRQARWRGWGGKWGTTVATQGSPDLQKSTAKQNSALCITGVNKIAPNFVTLVATYIYIYIYIYDIWLFKYLCSATYIYAFQRLMVKHFVCFHCPFATFEAKFVANMLLLHISHFSRSVRWPHSTNTSQICTEKTHMSSQQNTTWQSGSQRLQILIPNSAQLYYKNFSHSIPISGTFG